MTRKRFLLAALAVMSLVGSTDVMAQFTPTARKGYSIQQIATPLPDAPTGITVDGAGDLFVLTNNGYIFKLSSTFGDSLQTPTLWFDGTSQLSTYCTGITWHNGVFYVSHRGKISTVTDADADGFGDTIVDLITGLPFASDHQNNQIVFDGLGKMYFGLGSQMDHGPEVNPMSATIMRANEDGTALEIHATGVRNAFGLAYSPTYGLYAADNGPNMLPGNLSPVDEINKILPGADYGYPDYFGNPPLGSGTTKPAFEIPAHAAPTGMTFDLDGTFSGFGNDLYVCLFAAGAGSVARVTLDEDPTTGEHTGFIQSIASGFIAVIDCQFTPQGDLVCADFITRKLYRIRPLDDSRIRFSKAPRLGDYILVEIEDTDSVGDAYIAAVSDAEGPAFDLGLGRIFHMNVNSPVFNYTFSPNPVWQFPGGFLDANGKVSGLFIVPDLPALEGLTFWAGFISAALPSFELGAISETLPFVITN